MNSYKKTTEARSGASQCRSAASPRGEAALRTPKAGGGRRTIQERFDAWVVRHAEIEELYVRFSRELLRAGRKTYGVKAITERIRWHYATMPDSKEEFKISNSYTSRMARYLMDKYPDLSDFFNLRELRQK